jgi:hypothetical protein
VKHQNVEEHDSGKEETIFAENSSSEDILVTSLLLTKQ